MTFRAQVKLAKKSTRVNEAGYVHVDGEKETKEVIEKRIYTETL